MISQIEITGNKYEIDETTKKVILITVKQEND